MRRTYTKDHWCKICEKDFNYLGIARHRTMHYEQRKRGEKEHPKKYDYIKGTKTK